MLKTILLTTSLTLAASSSSAASWGFKMTPNTLDRATVAHVGPGTFTVTTQNDGTPYVQWENVDTSLEWSAWVMDWDLFDTTGIKRTFDFHVNNPQGWSGGCDDAVRVTRIRDSNNPSVIPDGLDWLQNNRYNDSFCSDDSHDVAYTSVQPDVAAVPLPAGAALMLTALGGFGIAARRRK